jgi:hypothetical protein
LPDERDDDDIGVTPSGSCPTIERGPQAEPTHWVVDPDTPATRPPARTKREPPAVIQGSVVEAIRARAPTSGEAAGFTMVPNLLIHGEIGARLERLAAGTAWFVVVLLRFAERKDHVIKATKTTLCRLAGIRKPETLDRRLRWLTRKHNGLGLPALLRKLPGTGVHYAFREDGIEILASQARRVVDQQVLRLAAIRKAQSRGGTKGMQTRWGGRDKSPAASRR